MAEIAGKVSIIYVIAGTTPIAAGTGTKLGGMDSKGLTQLSEMLDITAFGDNFKKRMPGIKDTAVDTSGNYDPLDAGQIILQTAYDNGTTVFVGIYPQGTGVAGKQVQCYVESIDIKATATGKQSFTPKFAPIAAPVTMPIHN